MKAFPYVYMGGGYWRERGAAVGKSAPILHGDEIVEAVRKFYYEEPKR